MKTTLTTDKTENIFDRLSTHMQKFTATYPGDSSERQPIHTLYGGAQLYKAGTTKKIGELSVKALQKHAPDAETFAKALDLPGDAKFWQEIYSKVEERLKECAVEDFRIDFEDGYGNRPDLEEDECAEFTAKETAKALKDGLLPPYIGIRIKPFNDELKERSVRTLDIFLTTLLSETAGKLPPGFIITLPKVSIPEQVTALADLLDEMESSLSLAKNTFQIEIMIETTQAIVDSSGICPMPMMVTAARDRCRGAHFGTYDYTASCDITAAYQKMDHPTCDYALMTMKNALAGTGVWLSDGATSVMPVGDSDSVHRAWKIAYDHIFHSLKMGLYQGWDLHPAQLPIRYAACYTFFLQNLEQASIRLKNFIEKAAQATLVGDVFDDAATGQGLLNYFLRALNSGAITEAEVEHTGLTLAELQSKSFVSIVKGRLG